MDKKIILKVNGKEVELNLFVKKVFVNVVNGLVDSLSNLPEKNDTIEVKIGDFD